MKYRSAILCLSLTVYYSLALAQEAQPLSAPPSEPQQAQPDAPSTQGRPIPGIRVQPQPQSPEEAAAYEKIRAEQKPAERIRLIEDFLLGFPASPMKELVYQAAMQAYQAQNDPNRMLTYGELALAENPDNLTALLTLASVLAETTDRSDPERDDKLDAADEYATRALDVLERTRKPPGVPEESWMRNQNESGSTAHAARGLVALIRENFSKAELELQEAVALASRPDPFLLYRLGLCHSFQKKYDAAVEVLTRAASLGGVKVAGPDGKARDLVAEALEFANRSRAASAPPAVEAPVPGPPEPIATQANPPASPPANSQTGPVQ